jgi:segregation and condensation protein A
LRKLGEKLASTEPYCVKLKAFEGPLDLLLHLIKKSEINIYDIPIAAITEQYLEYLDMMRELNIEIAGDYLVMAAELGLIKSKMLLPKPEPEKEEEEDPRAELVKRLIEYQRYKDAAEKLVNFEILERDVFARIGEDEEEEDQRNQPIKADLWSLIVAFREICRRRDFSLVSNIKLELETVTLDSKIRELISRLRECRTISFEELFNEGASRFDVIITFLAILELIKTEILGAFQDSPYAPIEIAYMGESSIF